MIFSYIFALVNDTLKDHILLSCDIRTINILGSKAYNIAIERIIIIYTFELYKMHKLIML